MDNQSFNSLNEEERKIALEILKQYEQTGNSNLYQSLLYQDYIEIPVDIETFLTDDRYIGQAWKDAEGKSKLYPFWLEQLKKLFPDNIHTSVNTVIASGARGLGKALDMDSLVLTERGFIKMRDISYNDKVYGDDGKTHSIVDISYQGIKSIYEITFTDNSTVRCSLDHLWQVTDHHILKKHKYSPPETKVVTTEWLLKHKLDTTTKRFEIPMCKPIDFPKTELPLDPYILGCLLGDGCMTESINYISITTIDDYILNKFKEEVSKHNYNLKIHSPRSYDITPNNKGESKSNNYYINILKKLNLYGCNSKTKFIPECYLYSSIEDRVGLLQGLLDTDGTASKSIRRCDKQNSYTISFATTSEKLRDGVIWLAQSLGGTAKYVEKESYWYKPDGTKKKCNNHFRVNIRLPLNIKPFRLERKLNLYNSCNHKEPVRYIKSIEKLGEYECQCIGIDSDNHLYITDNFIVTHNSEVCVDAIMCYLLYRDMCLKNALDYYHLKQTDKVVYALMNIKLALAEEIAINKFQNTIKQSPWFLARGHLTGRTTKIWEPDEKYNIDIKIGSQSDDLIGLPIRFAFFDEVSFQRNQDIEKQKQKAIDMIDTARGGMMTRFVFGGVNYSLLCLASSKRSEKSFLEEHIKTKLKSEPYNVMIIDKAVWDVKPKGTYSEETFNVAVGNKFLVSQVLGDEEDINEYIKKGYSIIKPPLTLKANFLDDIDRALCDFAGISSTELSKYISGGAVTDCLNYDRKNPFVKDIIEVGNAKDDTAEYKDFFDLDKIDKNMMLKPLCIHLDMSISGDMTGIAGTWIKGKKPSEDKDNQSNDLFFELAFSVSIKAPKGRQISFEKNRNFIRWLREQGFNIREVTSDTFQSYDLQQQLIAEGFNCSILSVDRVEQNSHICKPYQFLKSVIYEQRLDMYESSKLIEELVNLERNLNSGKVDHPDGGSKDIADALCGSVFTASKYAEEYAYTYGENISQMLDVNERTDDFDKNQMTIALEEELKRINSTIEEKYKPTNPYEGLNNAYIDNDIIIW